MEFGLFYLISAVGLGAALAAWRAWRNGNGKFLSESNLPLLLGYASQVVVIIEQEFKYSKLTKPEKDAARKVRATELMTAYAKELGFTITPELMTLALGAVEAAVYRFNSPRKI